MLVLEHLRKSHGAFRLGPLDLAVGGEVVAVLGPSGCGKTTLLKLVAGLTRADSGSISLDGQRLGSLAPEQRGAALVFQEGTAFPHLSARRNIAYAASSAEEIEPLAELLEIGSLLSRRVRTLSGGERRRVEVARALAADPAVLLLDEPTTGLDALIRRRLRNQLRAALSELDIPVLYVTHDQHEAAAVADRVAVMRDGALHQIGPPAEVFEHPATPFVASFTGNPNVLPVRLHEEPQTVVWNRLRLHVPDAPLDAGATAWLCIRPEQIRLEPLGSGGEDGLPSDASANAFEARVEEHVFEGGTYVLSVSLSGADAPARTLEANVLPPTFRRLRLNQERRVRVHLAPDTLHLIPRASGETNHHTAGRAKKKPSRLPA